MNSCETCRFWDRHGEGRSKGRCKVHAPAIVVVDGVPLSRWPNTSSDDWCGEWAEKDTLEPGLKAARPYPKLSGVDRPEPGD